MSYLSFNYDHILNLSHSRQLLYASYTFSRTNVEVPTPFLRDGPGFFSHLFYMAIPRPDLLGGFFFSR